MKRKKMEEESEYDPEYPISDLEEEPLQLEEISEPKKARFYGDIYPTDYEDSFNQFMAAALVENLKYTYSKSDFSMVGGNLIFFMKNCAGPDILERDYETECTKLRESYKVLTKRIEEIKRTTSEKVLAQPVNNFIRSIDSFLEAVLDVTHGYEILSKKAVSYKSTLDVSLCHDCLIQTYDMLNNNEVFILGDIDV